MVNFLALTNTLRPYMQQIMKMEVAPWIKDYTIDVDKVYAELILDLEEKNTNGHKKV